MNKENVEGGFFEIGKNYLIRTVTHCDVGKLIALSDKTLLLDDASWVADTGRFQNILENGLESESNSEIELFKTPVGVNREAMIDFVEYRHPLPNKQK
jgi:hypothetical protein